MKIQLKSNEEDLTIVTKGGGKVIVPNNTDVSTDNTLSTVEYVNSKIGNIDSILDSINGEVI